MIQLGAVGTPERAHIDPSGTVVIPHLGITLRWSVGTGDQWSDPRDRSGVRQVLLENTPVTETRLSVGSGDVVARCFVVSSPVGPMLVQEFENTGSTAVALGVHLGSDSSDALDPIHSDHTSISVAGDVRLWLDRPAREWKTLPNEQMAISPLPHTIVRRIVVPLAHDRSALEEFPSVIPPWEPVVKGWTAHRSQGSEFDIPSGRLNDAVEVALCQLLLAKDAQLHSRQAGPVWPDLAIVGKALVEQGLDLDLVDTFEQLRTSKLKDPTLASALVCLEHYVAMTGEVGIARELVHEIATISHTLHKSAKKVANRDGAELARGFRSAAYLFDLIGEGKASEDARGDLVALESRGVEPNLESESDRRTLELVSSQISSGDVSALENLDSLLSDKAPSYGWVSPLDNAAFLSTVRRLFVDDSTDSIKLFNLWPKNWLGQSASIHSVPSRVGPISAAVRWHGKRPALLWEISPHDHIDPSAITVKCPGLDPSWSSGDLTGEALLEPSSQESAQ